MYDVLQSSHETRRVRYICEDAPLTEAMRLMAQGEISGSSALVVQDKSERIVGIMTTKDVIKTIMACGKPDPFDGGALSGWNQKVKRVMTPSKDLVFLEPNGTLEEARALLALSGRRHLPILSGSTLLGVIAPKDLAKHLYLQRPEAQSAKYSSLQLSSHRGLPLGTRLHAPLGSAQQIAPIAMRSGVCSLPHPGKGTLGEDAFLLGPHLVGVADGVGSWWEHGIDPAKYALAIMHACRGECASQKVALELQPQQVSAASPTRATHIPPTRPRARDPSHLSPAFLGRAGAAQGLAPDAGGQGGRLFHRLPALPPRPEERAARRQRTHTPPYRSSPARALSIRCLPNAFHTTRLLSTTRFTITLPPAPRSPHLSPACTRLPPAFRRRVVRWATPAS
jgi:protein phosphatase PTC7